jgi:hypothetical protein
LSDRVAHGPRLTGAEFDARVAELYAALPAHATPEEQQRASRLEFDLIVDHRLGTQFPADRREALWVVQQRLRRRPFRMATTWALRALFPRFLARAANSLGVGVIDAYRSVLTEAELEQFFGKAEVDAPGLPFGRNASNH